MKLEAVNVRAVFVFHLIISTHVFYCGDDKASYNFGKMNLSKNVYI